MKRQSNVCNALDDHIIGLLHHRDYSELIATSGLIKHIRDREEFNNMIRRDLNFFDLKHMLWPVYTLQDYGDFRRSTNLSRFKYCPKCGAEIDWKAIKQMDS